MISDTMMAEYKNSGPGYNATARKASNITRILTEKQYAPYATLKDVFQFPFTAKGGNTAWIDLDCEDQKMRRK